MINTINIKQQQLKNGFFITGSGPELVFIMGSCRVAPYVNYFAAMPRFTVASIDPFNWNWNEKDDRVDYMEAITKMENHIWLRSMFSQCKIFIHEWYENAGMFNIKNIYNYGLKPSIDICIPNFNDCFILAQDIVNFDADIRRKAMQDYNVIGKLSAQTEAAIIEISNTNLEKFYKVCRLSDIPEMEEYVKARIDTVRFFWTSNHVSRAFTLAVFGYINQWFSIPLTVDPSHEDMFANNYTHLTQYDSFEWGEERKKLVV